MKDTNSYDDLVNHLACARMTFYHLYKNNSDITDTDYSSAVETIEEMTDRLLHLYLNLRDDTL